MQNAAVHTATLPYALQAYTVTNVAIEHSKRVTLYKPEYNSLCRVRMHLSCQSTMRNLHACTFHSSAEPFTPCAEICES